MNPIGYKVLNIFDYVPVVSSFTNSGILIAKLIIESNKNKSESINNHKYVYIKDKKTWHCVVLLIPIIGNIIVAIDRLKHHIELKKEKIKKSPSEEKIVDPNEKPSSSKHSSIKIIEKEETEEEKEIEETNWQFIYEQAEQGNADALYKIGILYEQKGHFNEAIEYYQDAAKQNQIDALIALGRIHAQRDVDQAITYYQLAISLTEKGDELNQQYLLAVGSLELGHLLSEKNLAEAEPQFLKAFNMFESSSKSLEKEDPLLDECLIGQLEAAASLARLYEENEDREKAIAWYKKGADLGENGAYIKLAALYAEEKNNDEFLKYCLLAAALTENPEAMHDIKTIAKNNPEFFKNYATSLIENIEESNVNTDKEKIKQLLTKILEELT